MEAILLLDLVETIALRIERIDEGKIVIFNDNIKIYRIIHGEMETPNKHMQDAAVAVTRINEIISKVSITISIE